jgi:tRNA U34 5-carboxymethylaminomethyl modifying GTPase MnmE/TrmE
MIPPAILPEINADLFIVKDNSNLVLTDFDLLYLFPSSNGHNSNDSKSKVLKGFRQSIDQLCHFLTQLCARVEASVDIDTQEEEQLAAIKQTLSEIEKDIENYNSIYKVKNALSPIISGLH